MKPSFKFLFDMIASVVNSTDAPTQAENIDWNEIHKISTRHGIKNLVAYAVLGGNYPDVDENLKDDFKKSMYLNMCTDIDQQKESESIFESFERARLKYMPIKGLHLKKVYPSSDMRRMCDLDILIEKDKLDEYKEVMSSLGFVFKKDSINECVYLKNKNILVELHRYMVKPSNDDLFAYFDTGWNFAKKTDGNEYGYELSLEDEYVYLIAHFAKHYRNAGAGIKAVIDAYLYEKTYGDINWQYIYEQFKRMNIYDFAVNVQKLGRVWFDEEESDDITEIMTEFIVKSGEYGTALNSAAAESVRDDSANKSENKRKSYLKLIFLDKNGMKTKYPVLKKHPYLLPVFWLYRIAEAVVLKRDKIKNHKKIVEYKYSDKVYDYRDHMEKVGLDIYNGRKK